MKIKLKIIIPTIIAIAAVLIAALCINFSSKESTDIEAMFSTAQKYLMEQDYEQAIAEFNKIIELDPMNADAYLGLAQAYIDMGDTEKAVETLEKGFEMTGDERIKVQLNYLLRGADAVSGSCSAIDNYECMVWFNLDNTQTVNSVWCSDACEIFSNYSYGNSSSEFNSDGGATETCLYYLDDDTYCGKCEVITDPNNQLNEVKYYDENNELIHLYSFETEKYEDSSVHTFQYENGDLLVSESIYYSENNFELIVYNNNGEIIEQKKFIRN